MTQFTGLPDAGIPWWLVFLPSWAAEFGTCVIILLSLSSSRLPHSPTWKLLQCATPASPSHPTRAPLHHPCTTPALHHRPFPAPFPPHAMLLPSPTAPLHPSHPVTPMASLPTPTPMASSLRRLTSLANAIANAAFKAMLMVRLQAQQGSWLLSFAPLYLGMWVQSVLHYRKPPDAHGKRPGSNPNPNPNPNQRPGSPLTLPLPLPLPLARQAARCAHLDDGRARHRDLLQARGDLRRPVQLGIGTMAAVGTGRLRARRRLTGRAVLAAPQPTAPGYWGKPSTPSTPSRLLAALCTRDERPSHPGRNRRTRAQ